MPVSLHIPNQPKPVPAETHTVSQTGAMLLVAEGFPAGAKFTIEHPQTEARIEVRILRTAQLSQGGSLQPVEFLTPSPNFWGVFFPPAPQLIIPSPPLERPLLDHVVLLNR
jgi:hypothetical protein